MKTEIASLAEATELIITRDDINTQKEYNTSYKQLRTEDGKRLPSNPSRTYKDCGWEGWANFLRGDPEVASLTEATGLLISRDDINTQKEYHASYKPLRTEDGKRLPANPNTTYKDCGWKSWPNFLRGDPEIASLAEATELLISRGGIYTQKEYNASYKPLRTEDGKRLPSTPERAYKDCGWEGWAKFIKGENLYTNTSSPEARLAAELSYVFDSEATTFRRKHDITELDIYFEELKIAIEYDGGYYHTGKEGQDLQKNIKTEEIGIDLYRVRESFKKNKLKKITGKDILLKKQLEIGNIKDLLSSILKHSPSKLNKTIVKNIKDYLKVDNYQDQTAYEYRMIFASLIEAQEIVVSRDDINTQEEYNASYKPLRTEDGKRLPSSPSRTYKDCGWESWHNFLRGEVKIVMAPLASLTEATELLVSRDDINTQKEYNASYKPLRTEDGKRLPSNPDKTYKDYGWKGWANLLRGEVKVEIASLTEAKKLILKQSTSPNQRKAA